MIRTYHHTDFDAARLTELKADHVISVCLPARNEQATVGLIVDHLIEGLVEGVGLVDEVIVVDDHSTDGTADAASAAGAKVVDARSVLPEYGDGHGKGEAMWKSLYASVGDIIVWCDADVRGFDIAFVVGLLGPLLTEPTVDFVKGFYDRPVGEGGTGGGRVTELAARPIISLLFPHLVPIVQPLAGEYAGRRSVLEQLPFVQGYGVDLGLLIDVAERFGVDHLAQTDLGARRHRNRPLDELSPQALAVLHTALIRTDPDLITGAPVLARPGSGTTRVEVGERPALVQVERERRRSRPA
jgi:glucosyl-3-phosphoglycerate synthase